MVGPVNSSSESRMDCEAVMQSTMSRGSCSSAQVLWGALSCNFSELGWENLPSGVYLPVTPGTILRRSI